jgi:hypothetical protein
MERVFFEEIGIDRIDRVVGARVAAAITEQRAVERSACPGRRQGYSCAREELGDGLFIPTTRKTRGKQKSRSTSAAPPGTPTVSTSP